MPTYDYRCDACGHELAAFQSITEDALTSCPACGEERLRRRIGAGAGIIFRGSGFYETDYKRNRGSAGRSSDSKGGTEASPKSSESKSDSKKE